MTEHLTSERTLVRLPIVRRFPNGAPLVFGVIAVTAVAVIDWISGPAVSLSLLYAVAVMGVTWLGTRRHGVLAAALAAAESLGAYAWAEGSVPVPAVWNAAARLGVLLVVAVLVGALRSSLIEQRNRAMVDSLTGALNRRAFHLVAERERLRAGRSGSAVTLAYFDLDEFKEVNDRRGHAVGDRLLRVFAASVRAAVRGTDVLCRIGGDEFVLMLPDTDARDAVVVVDRVRKVLADCCEYEETPVTASVGVATFRFPPSTVEAMVAGADELMYRAKARGGDTVVGTVIVGPWTRWSDQVAQVEGALEWV